jgi:hypothetical protein
LPPLAGCGKNAIRFAAVHPPVSLVAQADHVPEFRETSQEIEKENDMKLTLSSFVLALGLAIPAVAATTPATTVSEPAFTSFHVRLPEGLLNPAEITGCITESYGAAINSCPFEVHLAFNLPVYVQGVHDVSVQNYVNGSGTQGATCNVWSYNGDGQGSEGTNDTFDARGVQTLIFITKPFGNTIALFCDIPAGEGISSITWNP